MTRSHKRRTVGLVAAAAALVLLAAGCARAPERPAAVTLTAASFDEAISEGVALVDFWAAWCPPCKEQGPIVEKLASAYAGRALIGKVDVDKEVGLAARFSVKSIPTLILFKDGDEAQRLVGLKLEKDLRAVLDKALGEE